MNTNDIDKKIKTAELNLQRKLEWVSRYDSRIAFVAGIAIAMLGIFANASAQVQCWNLYVSLSFILAAGILFMSLAFIYCCLYPKTLSPNSSLIYFGTVAKMKFDDFEKKFLSESPDDYLHDLLCQTHINAEILDKKFTFLKRALSLIVISVIPWLIAIYFSKLYLK